MVSRIGTGSEQIFERNFDNEISKLSEEILLNIFSFLSLQDLTEQSYVCKKWCSISRDNSLWKPIIQKLPNLSIIDEKVWKTLDQYSELGIDFGDYTDPDFFSVCMIIKKLSSLKLEGNAGITLMTIPKGWTLEKLEILQKHAPQITMFNPDLSKKLEVVTIAKTKIVALTNSIIQDTRNLSYEAQKNILDKNGLDVPGYLFTDTLITLTTLTNLTGMKLPRICLFGDDYQTTYTRCTELFKILRIGHSGWTRFIASSDTPGIQDINIGMAAQKIVSHSKFLKAIKNIVVSSPVE